MVMANTFSVDKTIFRNKTTKNDDSSFLLWGAIYKYSETL